MDFITLKEILFPTLYIQKEREEKRDREREGVC